MIKKITVVLLLVLFSISLGGKTKIFPLPDLMKPEHPPLFDKTQMYIIEGTSVYIYSLTDFKLIEKFGKKGEGPKEFMLDSQLATLFLTVYTNDIVIESFGKLSWYTKDGTYKKEFKLPNPLVTEIQPFGSHFIGEQFAVGEERRQLLNLYDHQFNIVKEIVQKPHPTRKGKGLRLLEFMPISKVYENKLFLAWEPEPVIKIFDTHINPLYTVKLDEKPVKVSEEFKKKAIHYLKTWERTKDFFEQLKPIRFPGYFPAFQDIVVTGDKIHVLTWVEDEAEDDECLILDLKGKMLKRVFLPVKMGTPLIPHPFNIHKGSLYQVVENEEEE